MSDRERCLRSHILSAKHTNAHTQRFLRTLSYKLIPLGMDEYLAEPLVRITKKPSF